jgi:2-iminobutanoate/2-iminopropanoate deaminase
MTERQAISTDGAPAAAGPYSQAIRAGDFVFTAGQLGLDPATGEFAASDVAGQAERAITNLRAILEEAGTGLDRLVKVTVYLADIGDWPAVNEVYARAIPEPFPARSAFAVRDLPKGALVEIEAIAAAGVG